MEQLTHWTQESSTDFVYSISSSFVAQLESRMEAEGITQSKLAAFLGKSEGRVSQVLNNPGNMGLKLIVEYARSLGMKVSIVAYDDQDPANQYGPINPEVFVKSWQKINCPRDLFEVAQSVCATAQDKAWRDGYGVVEPATIQVGTIPAFWATTHLEETNQAVFRNYLQEPQNGPH